MSTNLIFPLRSDQHVRWLDVPMDDAAIGRVLQGFGQLRRVKDRVIDRHHTVAVHQVTNVGAFDVFENDVVPLVVTPHVEDAGDARMIQLGSTLSFVAKSPLKIRDHPRRME